MDFKKCFKKKEIVVCSKKNKAQTCKVEVNIKKNESGNKISKQMNTWALLSNWSQVDFHSEPLVTSLNSPKYPLDRSFAPVEIAILLWKPFIDFLCTNRPFGFSARASLFLGCLFSFFSFFVLFFYLFHCAFKTWTLFKINEIFYFSKEETL